MGYIGILQFLPLRYFETTNGNGVTTVIHNTNYNTIKTRKVPLIPLVVVIVLFVD